MFDKYLFALGRSVRGAKKARDDASRPRRPCHQASQPLFFCRRRETRTPGARWRAGVHATRRSL